MTSSSADEDRSAGFNYLSTFIVMSAPAMSTDNSQVGVAICPSF